MNAKTLIGAAVLAAVLILIGLLAYNSGAPEAAVEEKGSALFPELIERINDVQTLELTTSEGLFTFEKGASCWTLLDRGGYPVQMEKIRPALIVLADLEKAQEMTSNPESYSRLGVQAANSDLTAEFQSKQLTLKDSDGATIASLIVGKPREGSRGESFYCRRAGDAVSWLVRGRLPALPQKGDEWLDKKILEIQRADVRAGRIVHGDGEVLTVSKKNSETDFTLHELPADRELRYSSAANALAGSMQYLNFEDVLQAAEFTAPETPLSIASLWTRDGMRVTVEVWEKEEKVYAAFSAAYDPAGCPELVLGPAPPPEEGEDGEPIIEAEATPRPAAEVQPEVDALNARLTPWVFVIPEYSKNNFAKRIEDLLKPLPEEEPAEAEEPSIDNLGGDPPPPVEEADGTEEGAGGEEKQEQTEPPPVEKKTEDPDEGTGQ